MLKITTVEVLEQIYEHWRKNENVDLIVSIDKRAEARATQNSSNNKRFAKDNDIKLEDIKFSVKPSRK